MTSDEVIKYVQAYKAGRLQGRNAGGEWFTYPVSGEFPCWALVSGELRVLEERVPLVPLEAKDMK